MNNIKFQSFNEALRIKVDLTSTWEKCGYEDFTLFLTDDLRPYTKKMKMVIPQFSIGTELNSTKNEIHFPISYVITEIDLPKVIKEKIKGDTKKEELWIKKTKSLFYRLKADNSIPYYLMYITSSLKGIRFILKTKDEIINPESYLITIKQFLIKLNSYGITEEYWDITTINRAWYLPTFKKFFHLKNKVFSPEIKEPNKTIERKSILSNSTCSNKQAIETFMSTVNEIIKNRIDITNGYHNWLYIGFAIASLMGEKGRKYFHELSTLNNEYDSQKCDYQYNACLNSKGRGITINTFFYIARQFGVTIPNEYGQEDERFWTCEGENRIRIDYDEYFKFLHRNGLGRYNSTNFENGIFIKIDHYKKTVLQVKRGYIVQFTTDYLDTLNLDNNLKKQIKNAFLADSKILMTKNYAAIKNISVDFQKDTSNKAFFYFLNGVIEVTNKEVKLIPWEKNRKYVWEHQIIQHSFNKKSNVDILKNCDYRFFAKDVCSHENKKDFRQRYKSYRSIIGYMLHNFKDPSIPKAVAFMDSNLDDEIKGRTGKGLTVKALGKLRKVATEDGKKFNFNSQFNFSSISFDTNIFFIDDAEDNFDFKKLFSAITEGFMVEKKHENKFHIPYEDSPKVILTTNTVIKGKGDSFRGRIIEFEFSKFYYDGYSPRDKFGHNFYEGWDENQWDLFYNYLIKCVQFYLKSGLVETNPLNRNIKKVIVKAGMHFVRYIDENIQIGKEYSKNEVFNNFLKKHPNWGKEQRTFTSYAKEYFEAKGYIYFEKRLSNGRSFTILKKDDINREF